MAKCLNDLLTQMSTGTVNNSNTLQGYTPTTVNTADTIVMRDSNRDIWCRIMNGQATSALYADLAERYICKEDDVPLGTVICATDDPDAECEVCNDYSCNCVIGVVSTAPGFILDSKSPGILVGLIGKVPVRVIGPIKKKQILVSAGKGCARAIINAGEVENKIGYALETNLEAGEKKIMAFIK